jgi:hypothetical protein
MHPLRFIRAFLFHQVLPIPPDAVSRNKKKRAPNRNHNDLGIPVNKVESKFRRSESGKNRHRKWGHIAFGTKVESV